MRLRLLLCDRDEMLFTLQMDVLMGIPAHILPLPLIHAACGLVIHAITDDTGACLYINDLPEKAIVIHHW